MSGFLHLRPVCYCSTLLIIIFGLQAQADPCAQTRQDLNAFLKVESFPENWIETTQNDGKPLMIKMQERNGSLYFIFDKTKEGVWAEGVIQICKNQNNFVVQISRKDIKIGSAAPWPMKISMKSGAQFTLQLKEKDKMHVSTFGWSGDFIPDGSKDDPKK